MSIFALLMLSSAFGMIKVSEEINGQKKVIPNKTLYLLIGAIVGTLTGLLGAGGGFILIPTMVILIGLHMSNAVSTSLALISLNMIIGFAGYFHHSKYIDWNLLITITSFAILGMIIGHLLQKRMNDNLLRKIFILVMVCTALYTLVSELLLRK
ncbi:MAG: sulfite exporter TauE/SafE family protein [Saprospiraceae bacterium]|nr:sulfite exporter TauE/SafE family protein [Candidatus Vicinibacter affinis]